MYVFYGTALNMEIESLLQKSKQLSVSEISEKLKQKHQFEPSSENNFRRRIRRALQDMEQHDKVEKLLLNRKSSWFKIPVYKIKLNGKEVETE